VSPAGRGLFDPIKTFVVLKPSRNFQSSGGWQMLRQRFFALSGSREIECWRETCDGRLFFVEVPSGDDGIRDLRLRPPVMGGPLRCR
jgi:hypothetical protein